jgi:hypothetical protein
MPDGVLNVSYSIRGMAYADCRYVLAGVYALEVPGAIDPLPFASEIGPFLITAEACPPAG